MFVFTVTVTILFYIASSTLHLCDNGNCIFDKVQGGDVVVVYGGAIKATINCVLAEQCKLTNGRPLRIFAGKPIELNCLKKESCYGAEVNIGLPKDIDTYNKYVPNIDVSLFSLIQDSSIINCKGDSSFKKGIVNVNGGNLIQKVIINSENKDSFKDGTFECNLDDISKCDLRCKDPSMTKSCDGVLFKCKDNTKCDCEGNSCPKILKECTKSPCVITPGLDQVAICTNKISLCTIDCSKKDSCKYKNGKNVQIFSASKITNVLCTGENGCIGAKMHFGVPKVIPKSYKRYDFINKMLYTFVDCNGKSGCKQASITANGDIADVLISAKNYDSIKQSFIDINLVRHQLFKLICGPVGLNSCEKTELNCGGRTNCICDGDCTFMSPYSLSTHAPTTEPTTEPTAEPTLKKIW